MRVLWLLACLTIGLISPAESNLRAASPMMGDGVQRTGPVGPQGEPGAKGDRGDAGQKGEAGVAGAPGAQGPGGVAGPSGSIGPKGDVGPVGPAGQQGGVGAQGPVGPAGAPKRVERYTANANASGIVTYSWPTCAAPADVDIIPTWIGDTQIMGGVTAQTLSGATVLAKRSRATLLLSAGPFETAIPNALMPTVPVTVRVICN